MENGTEIDIVDQEAVWRDKSVRGVLTIEDVKEIVKFKRQERVSSAYAQKASAKKKVAAKQQHQEDMNFDPFDGLD